MRDKKMLGILSSANNLYLQEWDGTNNTWSTITPSPLTASPDSTYRPFDIAYEQNSGRCMVVYYDGAPGQVAYRVWSSTAGAWSVNETIIDLGTFSGVVNWVRLEPRPGTNEMMLGTLGANGGIYEIYGIWWNGSSWSNGREITTAASIATELCFDLAWESLSGKCMVLWGEGTGTQYDLWDSGTTSWDAGGPYAGPNIGATANWIELASDPSSNKIGFTSIDGGSDWNVCIWDNGWGGLPTEDTDMSGNATRITDIAWEKDSGKCIVVGVDTVNTRFDWTYWQSGSWAQPPSSAYTDTYDWGGTLNWLQLVPDPYVNKMILVGISGGDDIRTRNWTGSAWSNSQIHVADASDPTKECAMVAPDRHDSTPPTVSDFQGGDDVWRSAGTTPYNVDFNDTGGSKLTRFQTKVYSGADQTGSVWDDWRDVVTGINQDDYTANWQIDSITWNNMKEGYNYVSVRVYDGVGNVSSETGQEVFYVKKDTTPALVNDYQTGDDTWRNQAGTTYNVDFEDSLSYLDDAQYTVWTSTGRQGTEVLTWTSIFTNLNAPSYTTDWQVDFGSCTQGFNYVSVQVWDRAGNAYVEDDVFYIKKDTVPPFTVTDLTASPGTTKGQIKLTWTAPGDNGTEGNNTGGKYIVRYSSIGVIDTETKWNTATEFMNNWSPSSAGTQETHIITGLTVGTTYYIAIKARDKVPGPPYNLSGISNCPNSLPQSGSVYINEIYVSGATASEDWIELYNDRSVNISLNGWTLVYNNGTIDSPGTDTTVWTGTTEEISANSFLVITPGTNLDSSYSYHLKFRDDIPSLVDIIQWPVMSGTESLSRIYDGDDWWEKDPSPTQNYANSISTGLVRINEVSYDTLDGEFIELYNTDSTTQTLASWTLRNSNGTKFQFSKKIYPYSFSAVDFSSVDENVNSYSTVFGASGLDKISDFVVLENPSGQTVDRVTWQAGTTYRYYNYKATLVSYSNAATGNLSSPNTIGRQPSEGTDTEVDSADFTTFTTPTQGARNNVGTQPPNNTLSYPASSSVIPRRFRIDLSLGADSTGGYTDTLWFIRTGGSNDNNSPHIYSLGDLGIDLSTTTAQSVIITGVSTNDIDGNPLIDGAIYKFILNSDTGSGSANQIILTNITYDASIHTVNVSSNTIPWANNSTKKEMLNLEIFSNSPAGMNSIELEKIKVKFDDGATDLTTTQAQALFDNMYIVYDSTNPTEVARFQPDLDTYIGSVGEASFNLISGVQEISVDVPENVESTIGPSSSKIYFFVVELSSTASTQTPNTFRVSIDADNDIIIRDAPSDVVQSVNTTTVIISTTNTAIQPKQPPAGTSWPYSLGTTAPIYTLVDYVWNSNEVFSTADDGKLHAFDADGTARWTFTPTTPANIRSSPRVLKEDSNTYIYFANEAGEIYKIRDDGADKTQIWSRALTQPVSSAMGFAGDYVYVGCDDGKVYKLDITNGNTAAGWTFDGSISGDISSSPAIDEYTTGVNALWIGSEGGNVYRLATSDGTVSSFFATSGAVIGEPQYTAGYTQEAGTHNLYINSVDGVVYCRDSSNLANTPTGWVDYDCGSPMYGSVIRDWNLGDRLYFGADNGKMYCINSSSGAAVPEIWIYQTGGKIRNSPTLAGDYVYFGSDDGYLYALNVYDGTLKTGFPIYLGAEIRSSVVYDGSKQRVYIGTVDGKIHCFYVGP
ncbi:hypothetical protein DRN86_02675 [Candidatus Geothermarchaeota archaeon]|nr:MAG: hypothetical protein DRN86_02675 [Candidatus Geothermarchaeota archaeon]